MKFTNQIIYIGGNGKLASYLKNSHQIISTSRNQRDYLYFDLNNYKKSTIYNKLDGCTIIFGAAISSPDYCHNNPEECYDTNYINTANAIKLLLTNNRVIFLSSDLVFSGNNQEIELNEKTTPKPIGLYEKLKYQIEKEFFNYPLFHTIRLSFVEFRDNSFFSYLNYCFTRNEKAEIIHPLIRHTTDPEKIYITIKKYHTHKINYPIVNLSGIKQSRIDLLAKWEKQSGNKVEYEIIPIESSNLKHKPKYINFKSLYV